MQGSSRLRDRVSISSESRDAVRLVIRVAVSGLRARRLAATTLSGENWELARDVLYVPQWFTFISHEFVLDPAPRTCRHEDVSRAGARLKALSQVHIGAESGVLVAQVATNLANQNGACVYPAAEADRDCLSCRAAPTCLPRLYEFGKSITQCQSRVGGADSCLLSCVV